MIRSAKPEEAPLLIEITMRAKTRWGYDEGYLARFREQLGVTPQYIASSPVYVALERHLAAADNIAGERIVGYYGLLERAGQMSLEHVYIDPDFWGKGYGAALFKHAIHTAQTLGMTSILIETDPNAIGFFQRMGAEVVGERPSLLREGEKLPLLQYTLPQEAPFG
jgi:ribosomal protein S18 acetylase RimI-like enzyme